MPWKDRSKKKRHGKQSRRDEGERNPPPCGPCLVVSTDIEQTSRVVATTDFQVQGAHDDLQKEIEKVSTLQINKSESNERGSLQTPTKGASLQEHAGGGDSRGQYEGACQQNKECLQEHNELKTEEPWHTVPSRKSNKNKSNDSQQKSIPESQNLLRGGPTCSRSCNPRPSRMDSRTGHSVRETSPCRSNPYVPRAANIRPHVRYPLRSHQQPSAGHLKKMQGQEAVTQLETDTEVQRCISDIKKLIKEMYKDKDGGHRSKDIGSEIFQTLARQDFPKAFKEAYCVPPWLPPCVCPSQTTRPAQGRALHQRDGDVEGLRAECLVSRTFRALSVWFAKHKQPSMFIIVKFCLDNLLGWLGPRGTEKLGTCQEIFWDDISSLEIIQRRIGRREADLVVLHPEKSIIFVEVKAVGSKDESRKEEIILKKIGKAVDGLKKDTEILTSVMTRSSYSKGMQMQLVVALPNVSRTQLEEVRACSKRKLKGVNFLCKDELLCIDNDSVPDVEKDLNSFRRWWDNLPTSHSSNDDLGLIEVIGKYVGRLSLPVNPRDGNQLHQLRHISDCVRHAVRLRELLRATQNEKVKKTVKSKPCCSQALALLKHVEWMEAKEPAHHRTEDQEISHCFGLSPLCIRHRKHNPKFKVTECRLCGKELATFLKAEQLLATCPQENSSLQVRSPLHNPVVGGARLKISRDKRQNSSTDAARCEEPPSSRETLTDSGGQRPAPAAQPGANINRSNIVPVVMFNLPMNHSDPDDNQYSEYLDTCPFIQALRKERVDVHVTRDLRGHDSDVVARGMVVSCVDNCQGIEEAVVVFVPSELAVIQGAEQQEGGVNTESSAPTVASMEWESGDIRRFHPWDRTNMAVAGSRCFGLFILMVP